MGKESHYTCCLAKKSKNPHASISLFFLSRNYKHQQREDTEMSRINIGKENVEEEEQGNGKRFSLNLGEPNIFVG